MQRFEGLDRMRGLALGVMLVHHAVAWTSGSDHARQLLGFDDGMAVTDLAAPMFAVAVGASAHLVGGRVRSTPADRWPVARRWLVIGAWGIAIGIALDGHVDSFGVLEALAVVGAAVTLLAGALAPRPVGWVALAVTATFVATAVVDHWRPDQGTAGIVLAGGFPIVTYFAFAAWGAVAVAVQGRRERGTTLVLMTGLAVVAVVELGAWPPDRHPGGLPFLLPGIAATLALWGGVALLPSGWATDGLARAGRRTLVVFVGHYALRIAMDRGGWTGELTGPGWLAAGLAVAGLVFLWGARPARGIEPAAVGKRDRTAGLVPSHG